MSRQFEWGAWDFDGDGQAYIIAKDVCPNKEDVPDFICRWDNLPPAVKPLMVVEEGWGKWQMRTDWMDYEGEKIGGYKIEMQKEPPKNTISGKKKPGWFPVWIVRQRDEWY